MDLLTNAARSITGSIEKAILCVKMPGEAGKSQQTAKKDAVDLQAKLAGIRDKGIFTLGTELAKETKMAGYHMLKVRYNPATVHLDARAGTFFQSGPGGEGNYGYEQSVIPAQTVLSFDLVFDEENHSDAFMFDKFTNTSAGQAVSNVAGVAKNIAGDGYTVQPYVEAFLGLMTRTATRQVIFYWGGMVFAGEVVSIDARYTMFNPIGNPVRAIVRMSIREGEHNRPQEQGNQNSSNNAYWNDAFNSFKGRNGNFSDKAGNLLNFK